MRRPSKKRLLAHYRDLTPEAAEHVRKLASLTDDGDALADYIAAHCPTTDAYARSCHGNPFNSQMWRVTMTLHAIDVLVGGNGVEGLGRGEHRNGYAPPYEYVNEGDPYTLTLIYKRDTDNLFLGCWGDIAERMSEIDRGE